jgi:hypothetical protein
MYSWYQVCIPLYKIAFDSLHSEPIKYIYFNRINPVNQAALWGIQSSSVNENGPSFSFVGSMSNLNCVPAENPLQITPRVLNHVPAHRSPTLQTMLAGNASFFGTSVLYITASFKLSLVIPAFKPAIH